MCVCVCVCVCVCMCVYTHIPLLWKRVNSSIWYSPSQVKKRHNAGGAFEF